MIVNKAWLNQNTYFGWNCLCFVFDFINFAGEKRQKKKVIGDIET